MPLCLPADLKPFRPHRWLRGGHSQTIGPQFLRPPRQRGDHTCHIVEMRDGDQLAVIEDRPAGWEPGQRTVIGLHGLSGSHQSRYLVRLAGQLVDAGIHVLRPDMRGFGDSTLISRGHCNAGAYSDLDDIVQWVRSEISEGPLTIVGFSLGANILLQYLARDPDWVPENVDSAFAVAPPVDLLHCAWNLRQGFNRVYDMSFVKSLHKQLHLRRRHVQGLLDIDIPRLPNRLLQFDDQYTAIVCGFNGAREYYAHCSSSGILHRIQVPTNILLAADDPLIPLDMFGNVKLSSCTQLLVTESGGHLGYVGKSESPEAGWLDQSLANWILQLD